MLKRTVVFLDEEIEEQELIDEVSSFYKNECYIYAIIPDYEEELFTTLSSKFNSVKTISLSRLFKWDTGEVGYVKDLNKQFIYEFYLRSISMDYIVFSETDMTEHLSKLNRRGDFYKLFESNGIHHITIGPDGQCLNVMEYE
ncbi:hypothetical protein [Peribacillus frigoritolerans]|uniref:hypothetical protein n=1 Tax=Peribacillus frigoritolerans TaxID=450367 RepID=UPI001059C8D4|nr:hypothetical protein [Peribacillus frigoritolerans]TDL82394.1 hypothetical protein E2R53_02120 [Peribacillus frigoritolerans]